MAVKQYGISKTTLAKWRRRYRVHGYEGLEIRTRNRSYSAELKLQAVKDCLYEGLSQYEVIDKYKIASRNQLASWIKKYNGHSSLKAYTGEKTAMSLGLALCMSIVQRHHGTIDVKSRQGEGTVFIISFPLDPYVHGLPESQSAVASE